MFIGKHLTDSTTNAINLNGIASGTVCFYRLASENQYQSDSDAQHRIYKYEYIGYKYIG